MTYPPTGPNPSQSGGDAAGVPQYGAPQYGGAPMPGYPAAPPPVGGQWGVQRPGTATAAGVLGIIFTTVGFFAGAFNVIVLTGAAESDLFAVVDGFPMVLYMIAAIGMLVASVMGFIGAIQLLSGKTNQMLILATVIYVASRVLAVIGDLVFYNGNRAAEMLVSALVGIVLAIVLIFLARGSDVQQWLERKKAATSAGAF
ncbi:proline-rich domain-containing protein [Cumulibacter soli]|uniref:proline-rich domain-containing protein n=1 Tax=Cumulibacter soli TaxID=2546344 RepID=UPI001068907C|nr:proline-rich domain-containing protein [Cumulibacter soli]